MSAVIVPIPGKPGFYSVSTGGGTYETSETSCSCPHFLYRCVEKPGEVCKHITALVEVLEIGSRCPVCEGRGEIRLRCQYPTDEQPVCALCDGTGIRDAARLKEMFR